jgi:ribulose-phosphate 3-epimerase
MEKVKKARLAFPHLNIEVDGGVNKENMHIPIKAGANVIVSGTGLFNEADPGKIMGEMKSMIDSVTMAE